MNIYIYIVQIKKYLIRPAFIEIKENIYDKFLR